MSIDHGESQSPYAHPVQQGSSAGSKLLLIPLIAAGAIYGWYKTGAAAAKRIDAEQGGGLRHAGWAAVELSVVTASGTAAYLASQFLNSQSSAYMQTMPRFGMVVGTAATVIAALPLLHIVTAETIDTVKKADGHFPIKSLARKLGIAALALGTAYVAPEIAQYANIEPADRVETFTQLVSQGPLTPPLRVVIDTDNVGLLREWFGPTVKAQLAEYNLDEVGQIDPSLAVRAATAGLNSDYADGTTDSIDVPTLKANMADAITKYLPAGSENPAFKPAEALAALMAYRSSLGPQTNMTISPRR